MVMEMRVIKTCPHCSARTIVPWHTVLSAPLWPFGTWSCGSCHIDIRYKLMAYYLTVVIGLVITISVSFLVETIGFSRGDILNAFVTVVTFIVFALWAPAKLGVPELGKI